MVGWAAPPHQVRRLDRRCPGPGIGEEDRHRVIVHGRQEGENRRRDEGWCHVGQQHPQDRCLRRASRACVPRGAKSKSNSDRAEDGVRTAYGMATHAHGRSEDWSSTSRRTAAKRKLRRRGDAQHETGRHQGRGEEGDESPSRPGKRVRARPMAASPPSSRETIVDSPAICTDVSRAGARPRRFARRSYPRNDQLREGGSVEDRARAECTRGRSRPEVSAEETPPTSRRPRSQEQSRTPRARARSSRMTGGSARPRC